MGDYRLRKLAQDINSTFGKILKLNSKCIGKQKIISDNEN